MKFCKDLVYILCSRYLLLGLVIGVFETTLNFYVRLDVKWSATHCKGFQKITIGANMKISSLKGLQCTWECYAKVLSRLGLILSSI